jgi:predicted  nucleic acid-binding Zn-ribbon protein
MSQAQQLYRLQQIDSEIRQKKARLGEVLRLQQESQALRAARLRAETAAASLHRAQAKLNDLNLELGTVSNKARRTDDRLYSGNVKNPKELADLQAELEALGRRRAALEDEVLEAMIVLEDGQAEQEAAAGELRAMEDAWGTRLAELKVEGEELALRLHDLAGERSRQTAMVDDVLLAEYDELARRKGGVAVAVLRDNSCQGCHVSLSATVLKRAERGELLRCPNCDRILFLI